MRTDEDALGLRFRERLDQLLHLVEGPVEIIVGRVFVAPVDRGRRIAPRAEDLALGHQAGLDQVIEHGVGAGTGRRQIDVRREARRRLEQTGQHRGLAQGQVARGLVEVVMRRAVDAERAAAQIGAVEIEFEDLVLGQPHLEPHGEEGFLHLALDGPFVAEKKILRQLLAERGAALHNAAGARIGEHGAERAGNVDAEMLVEAAVLGGQHRLDQMIGELLQRDRIVVLDAAAADRIAVAVEETDGQLRLLQPVVVGGFAERGNGEGQHEQQSGHAPGRPLGQRLDQEPSFPAGGMETVHESGEALVELARPGRAGKDGGIHPRVEVQQGLVDFRFPALRFPAGKEVAHQNPLDERRRRREWPVDGL